MSTFSNRHNQFHCFCRQKRHFREQTFVPWSLPCGSWIVTPGGHNLCTKTWLSREIRSRILSSNVDILS